MRERTVGWPWDEADKYKMTHAATGRRKLNVAKRDIDRQREFQDTMNSEGWYMVAVPETREERAAAQIAALSGTKDAGGAELDTWVPRIPPPGGGGCKMNLRLTHNL